MATKRVDQWRAGDPADPRVIAAVKTYLVHKTTTPEPITLSTSMILAAGWYGDQLPQFLLKARAGFRMMTDGDLERALAMGVESIGLSEDDFHQAAAS